MGQHILFQVLAALLWGPAVHGFRTHSVGQDLEVQVTGKTGSITEERCGIAVTKVQKSKSYTEESIRPICDQEIKSSRCDFFAEALSLASSHSDFDGHNFCEAIVSAQFCAQTMDRLLTTQAMADLARGDCLRASNTRGPAYCERFQKMLAYSVQNDDLDTMRACYMMEAYSELGTTSNVTNHTEASANRTVLHPTHDSPEVRIISSSSKELDAISGRAHTPTLAANQTASQSADEATNQTSKQPSADSEGKNETIVTDPAPANSKGKSEAIVTEPVPENSDSNSTISADPIYLPEKNEEVPATKEEAERLKPIGSVVNSPSADTQGTQPAATVPAATVSTMTRSQEIPEVRLNIGGPANLLSTKAKAQLASKLLKRNTSH